MNLRHFVPALALLATIAFLPSLASAQKIATVNPAEVFDQIKEKKDAQADLDAKINKLKDEDSFKQKELQQMKKELDGLKPDSPLYKKMSEDLLRKAIDYDAWQKIQQANAQRSQKELMVNLYTKISHAVSDEAKKKGYDLVIAKQGAELPDKVIDLDPQQIRAILSQRIIIYDAGTTDLTQTVIVEMDKAYLRGSTTRP